MNLESFCDQALQKIKTEGRYRYFRTVKRLVDNPPFAYIDQQPSPAIVWCSNDYLGLSQHPTIKTAMREALDTVGTGAGGTRNISGTTPYHVHCEQALAAFHHQEAALVMTSGFIANQATLSTLGRSLPNCVFFSDEKNHASIIEGIRQSGAEKHIFRHNDVAHLETLLKATDPQRPKMIVWESLYSMDGDIAPSIEICALAKQYNAITYLDEVHAVGLYGPTGAGFAEQLHLKVDIIQATLGKAFGVIGGYIAAKSSVIDYIRSVASGFIFTTALPPSVIAGALAVVKELPQLSALRAKLLTNAKQLRTALTAHHLPYLPTQSHIVPVMVRNAHHCRTISDALLQHGHYVQPINYPTVPNGQERLRLTVSPFHTEPMIGDFVQKLACIWQQVIPNAA